MRTRSSRTIGFGAVLSCFCAGILLAAGCSPKDAGSTASAGTSAPGAPAKPTAADPHAADARPSSDEIQTRLQKVQSDPHLSPEQKALLTKQMQSAARDPRAAGAH